mmetsp:Transcript_11539/g.26804  ORF Transcript_11539/g.26804 Transcript_11539/m.26804 type:complete len:812 (+) Transcript_11539:92-2527(+)|eukprot:CAMPEP_0178392344 /NCGR_PEP_ID=MMETSP0689_2-20121128/11632_1 /TAXON_ID=160604 /ORGANISM="Amphidinium massartii, Strain CS-259" /LENGTH=811 /DNA_ID=CAMNT_0020012919 /DNA_START=31 /DNA_END=2466 /DNA_ORIENTATION=-
MGGRRRGGKQRTASSPVRTQAGTEGSACSGQAEEQKFLPLDLHGVLKAIESLYVDQLKPFGRILRKRVAEHSVNKAGGMLDLTAYSELPEVDIAELRGLCDNCPLLCVRPEEGGDWSAVFVDKKPAFVDVYCPVDVYAPEMWNEAAVYFSSLGAEDMTLPGGRYSCAQALMARNLPFLVGRTLGQVCHIVQLCISQKKLLGYLNGAVVPYGRSQSMVKERCAVFGQPCATHPVHQNMQQMASWEVARVCLQEILSSASTNGAPGAVPLSNMKRLFRSRYRLELSETALGHSKLSELLQDYRLKDICTVQLHGHGYMVVQVQQPYFSQRNQGQTITLADKLFPVDSADGRQQEPQPQQPQPPFYGAPAPALEPLVLSSLVSDAAPPRGFCLDEPLSLEEAGIFVDAPLPLPLPVQLDTQDSTLGRWPALSPSTLSKEGRLGQIVQNTFIHANPPPPTPLVTQRRRAQSLPKDMGSDKSEWETTCHALSFKKSADVEELPKPPAEDRIIEGNGTSSTADSPAPGSRTASSQPSSPDGVTSVGPDTAGDIAAPSCIGQGLAGFVWPETPLWPPTPAMTHDPAKTWASSFPPVPGLTAPGLEPARISLSFGKNGQGFSQALEPKASWEGCVTPKDVGLAPAGIKPFAVEPLALELAASEPRSRLEFCPDEPLCLEDAGIFTEAFFSKPPTGLSGMVHNTFIHAAPPPPTPPVGSMWRSRSVPRDIGSDIAKVTSTPAGSPIARPSPGGRSTARHLTSELRAVRSPASSPLAAAHSPAFLARVPPSPALTASPIYCCGSKTYSEAPQRVLHLSEMI